MKDLRKFILDGITVDPNGCWIWKYGTNTGGYGRTRDKIEGERLIHRISYRAFIGEIPEGLRVLHRCDNRPCCNWQHLFAGTSSDNVQDAIAKGRHVALKGELCGMSKLTRSSVEEIRSTDLGAVTITQLAVRHGVSRRAIRFVLDGATWA